MHRSGSTSRASDEFLIHLSPPPKGSPGLKVADIDKLPKYDTISDDATKKDTSSHHKSSSGDNVIHLIPIIMILCGLTLWVFSHPVGITRKGGMVTEKVEGLNIHVHGNQTDLSSTMESKKLDHPEEIGEEKAARFLENKVG